MNRLVTAAAMALGVVLAFGHGRACAQYNPYSPYSPYTPYPRAGLYNPYSSPALSPYLNLRRGGSPAANYYLGVVPEVQRRQQYNQLNAEIRDVEQRRLTPLAPDTEALVPQLPETGHATQFLNVSPYFTGGNPYYNPPAATQPQQRQPARGGRGTAPR
jgi:hypothetical protein